AGMREREMEHAVAAHREPGGVHAFAVAAELLERRVERAHRRIRFRPEPARPFRRDRKDDDGRNERAVAADRAPNADLRRAHGVVAPLAGTVQKENDRPAARPLILARQIDDVAGAVDEAGRFDVTNYERPRTRS